MAFCWQVDDGSYSGICFDYRSPLKINGVKVGPPLTKLSGSTHEAPHFWGPDVGPDCLQTTLEDKDLK